MDEPRARTVLSHHLIQFQRDEEEKVLSSTPEEDREEVLAMYRKTKITAEDMLREYTAEEVRELCLRTKVRVKMYKLNTVWDSKRYLEKQKRLEKRSASWINRMLVKAHNSQMMEPYTDLEKEKYKVLAACQTKKDNNVRLDRWHRQRAKAAYANRRTDSSPPKLNDSDSSGFEMESEPELLSDSEPEILADPQPELILSPSNMPAHCAEPSPASFESQSQSHLYECTMGEFIQLPVIQPSAPPPVSYLNNEPNLWGIGDRDEQEEHEEQEVAEKQLDCFDWEEAGHAIHSESITLQDIGSTQNTEPDYECLGTEVVDASM